MTIFFFTFFFLGRFSRATRYPRFTGKYFRFYIAFRKIRFRAESRLGGWEDEVEIGFRDFPGKKVPSSASGVYAENVFSEGAALFFFIYSKIIRIHTETSGSQTFFGPEPAFVEETHYPH